MKVIKAYLEEALAFKRATPREYRSRISIIPSTTFEESSGAYNGSRKVPDLAILLRYNENCKIPRIVFEIGVSESYNHPKQNKVLSYSLKAYRKYKNTSLSGCMKRRHTILRR